jgi:hypothetical protein
VFAALTTESALMQDYFRMMIDQKRLRDFLASEIGRTNYASTPWEFTPPTVPDTANPDGLANVDAVTRKMQADWVMLTWDTHGPLIAMLPDAEGTARNAFPYRPAPKFPPIKVKNAQGDLVDGPAPDAAFKPAGSGLSVRSPLSGFITLELDIVQALTDSGFGWGPATWGLDVMHFEVMSVAAQIERDLAAEMAKD